MEQMKSQGRRLLGAAVCTCLPFFLDAQTRLFGEIRDARQEPVTGATVLLFRLPDSTFVKGALADAAGRYALSGIVPAQYFIKATFLGFTAQFSSVITVLAGSRELDLGALTMRENGTELDEVTVTATRPLFEQSLTGIVVNVSNTVVFAGSSALDVLEKSPNVTIDRANGTVSILGKSGVQVMINGRLKYMPVSALMQMLAAMPADNIEKIEIITAPSSNLDAEGNAGYLNIVLKRAAGDGFNGSATMSVGYGRGVVGNASVNANYRRGRLSVFGDASYLHDARPELFSFDRRIVRDGERLQTTTASDRRPRQNNPSGRVGLDYELSDRTVLGVLVTAFETNWKMLATNTTDFIFQASPDTFLMSDTDELHRLRHWAANVNLQHNFTPDRTLSFDADYLSYYDVNPTAYVNRYRDEQGQPLSEERTRSSKNTPIGIAVAKADYTHKLDDRLTLQAGIKGVRSTFTNDIRVNNLEAGVWQPQADLTGIYDLIEMVGAAYASATYKPRPNLTLQAGLRYEYTHSNLGTPDAPDLLDRRYGLLAPTVFVQRQFGDHYSAGLSYTRRITRPTFTDMAPFVIFIDPTTFFSGNTGLQPAIANSIGATARFKDVIFNVSYTHEDSTIAMFQPRFDVAQNRMELVSQNLRASTAWNVSLNFPVKLSTWWQMQYNLAANRQTSAVYFNETLRDFEQTNYNVSTFQRFSLPANFSVELNAFYRSAELSGAGAATPMHGVGAGLRKRFGERGGTLSFNVDDVFNAMVFGVRTDLPEQQIFSSARIDFSQRTFRLGYSRAFGSEGVKAARERREAEERARIK